jgi:hypothetical protein
MFALDGASDAGSDDRMSSSIQPSNGIEFTDVPPPDPADVERRLRLLGHLDLLNLRDRATHRAHRVRHAERAEAVARRGP